MKEHYTKLIYDSIKTIINQFHRKPDNFFNEHEFHHYCYHVFYRKKEFSKQYETKEGRKTNILHPEYPTLQKFSRKNIAIDPRGKRARYDMAILNPDFIVNNEFEKVRCRDISKFKPIDYRTKNLVAAMEFKFIIKHGNQFKHEILYDHIKLKNAEEADLKCMLVFTNTIDRKIDYFKDQRLHRDKEIKKIYVAVYIEGGKKIKRIKQYPECWLDNKV